MQKPPKKDTPPALKDALKANLMRRKQQPKEGLHRPSKHDILRKDKLTGEKYGDDY